MKAVFADFDGVIFRFGTYNFSGVACKNFQSILDQEPDLKIVISSSWRHLGIEQCKRTLDANGIDSSRVVDITGDEPGERGNQIKAYLARNPQITHYVILDDESGFTGLEDHFVKTSSYVGLTTAEVQKALDILKKPC